MPRLADSHCSVQLFTAQGRNSHVDVWMVTLLEAIALGIWAKMAGWLPAMLLANLSGKEMSF